MHNCKANRETLIALALNPHDHTQLPAELEQCAGCREEYAGLRTLLRVVNQTKQSALPAESFWTGYHTRLRQRPQPSIFFAAARDRKSTRLNSSHQIISY